LVVNGTETGHRRDTRGSRRNSLEPDPRRLVSDRQAAVMERWLEQRVPTTDLLTEGPQRRRCPPLPRPPACYRGPLEMSPMPHFRTGSVALIHTRAPLRSSPMGPWILSKTNSPVPSTRSPRWMRVRADEARSWLPHTTSHACTKSSSRRAGERIEAEHLPRVLAQQPARPSFNTTRGDHPDRHEDLLAQRLNDATIRPAGTNGATFRLLGCGEVAPPGASGTDGAMKPAHKHQDRVFADPSQSCFRGHLDRFT
jgi:hypothetical protein